MPAQAASGTARLLGYLKIPGHPLASFARVSASREFNVVEAFGGDGSRVTTVRALRAPGPSRPTKTPQNDGFSG